MPAKPFGLVSTDALETARRRTGGRGPRRAPSRRRREWHSAAARLRRPPGTCAKSSENPLHAEPGTSFRPAPGPLRMRGCRPSWPEPSIRTLSRVMPCARSSAAIAGTTSPASGIEERIDLRRDARDRCCLRAHVRGVRLIGLDRDDAPASRRYRAAERGLGHRRHRHLRADSAAKDFRPCWPSRRRCGSRRRREESSGDRRPGPRPLHPRRTRPPARPPGARSARPPTPGWRRPARG